MPAIPPNLETVTTDIAVDDRWTVRMRSLTTTDAARAGVLVEMLASLTAAKDRKKAVGTISPERLAQVDAMASRVLCECVEAGSVDGEDFEDLRLVIDRKQHDPEAKPPRLWVGAIPGYQRGAIVAQALMLHAEAEGILRPFRREPADGADAPSRVQAVQPDAAGVDAHA